MGLAAATIGAAVIGGGAAIISGNKAAGAQKDAANQAAQSAADANALNKYIYDTTRSDYAPYRQVGTGALYKLADMYGVSRPTGTTAGTQTLPADTTSLSPLLAQYGLTTADLAGGTSGATGATASPAMTAGYDGFQASPGYQFRLNEGLKAIQNSAAARGGLRSGATMKSLARFADGTASAEFENYANRLAALAGVGQTATSGSAQAGQAYGSAANQNAANMGNAYMAAGNARASAYQNTGNAINGTVQNLASGYLYGQGYGGSSGFAGPAYPSGGYGTPAAVANPTAGWGGTGSQWWMS